MKNIGVKDNYVQELILQGEHQQQDFKFEISDARKIAKSLSAFANTDGGRLLIGVKDNGKIAGVRSEEEAYMIESAANVYCSPEVRFSMTQHRVEGKVVLEVSIPEAENKPVCAKNEENKLLAYVRIADENILASPIHLEVWKQKKGVKGKLIEYTEIEKKLLDKLSDGDFSMNRFCRETGLLRRDVQALIANFVRFGVVRLQFLNRKWTVTVI
jgi:predicted HTH transcriptional regulator